jgi:TraM recognition site of TraD and TraG
LRLFTRTLWSGVPEAFGPIFELYFRNAMLLLMEGQGDQATFLDFERVFQDEAFREELLERCQTQNVKDFWQKTVDRITYNDWSLENLNPYITSKFSPFTSNALLRPVLGSATSSLDLQAAIAGGKIVLLNLAKGLVGEGSARLVGALVTMRLVAAAQTQMKLPASERKAFVAYLDEFQTYATEHIGEAIEETRKYRLSLVLACQSLGQIDGRGHNADVGRSIIANVANLIAFRLGVEDAAILAKWFEPDFSVDELLYLPNYTAVARLMVDGQALRPIEFRAAPPRVPLQ